MNSLDPTTVRRIQERCGLSAENQDGVFGPMTLQAIDETLAEMETFLGKQHAGRAPSAYVGAPAGDLCSRIVIEAARFVGLTEIIANRKWDDLSTSGPDDTAAELARILEAAGWQPGWPYCAAFVEAVWTTVYAGSRSLAEIREVLGPHCLTSWRKASAKGWASRVPQVGAIGIMQKGATDQGHAFIVRQVSGSSLQTIEANTSPALGSGAADREGDGVYAKPRRLDFTVTPGLHLIGFILPPTA